MNLDPQPLLPPLKWAGGKRWLVPYLMPIWQKYSSRRLVEPFCGGLAVTLGLLPKRGLLNDINPHLVNFYRQLKSGLTFDIQMENDSDLFYRQRERFNALIKEQKHKTSEAAQLFYYLNRTCFNGLCRFNKSGFYNVPFGCYKTINYKEDFLEFKPFFANWDFQCGGFNQLNIIPDDFIYADPPYDVEFTQYSAGGFNWDEQILLAHWLKEHSGPVVLSNQLTPRIEELYSDLGFNITILDAPRRISCTGDRKPAKEVLATLNL